MDGIKSRVQNKNSNLVGHVQKMLPCIQSLHSKYTVNVPTKMKVDWPYSEIGQKMANGQLLFCTLLTIFHFTSILPIYGITASTINCILKNKS